MAQAQPTSRVAATYPKFSFSKINPAKEINDRCLGCHAGGTQQTHAINSGLLKNEVSCIACHLLHDAEPGNSCLLKPSPNSATAAIYSRRPQFEMPFHHRVNEGLIQCTDCHNPHGTVEGKTTPGHRRHRTLSV